MVRTVLDLDNYVPALITFVSNKLSAGASNTYRKLFDVGITEWRIIALLAIEPSIPANRICQVIGFDKALVSRSVQLMADRGIVSIVPDDTDARRKTIALTKAGNDLHDRIIQVALEREQLLLQDLAPEERLTLIRLLHRLHARVADVNAHQPELRLPRKRRQTFDVEKVAT